MGAAEWSAIDLTIRYTSPLAPASAGPSFGEKKFQQELKSISRPRVCTLTRLRTRDSKSCGIKALARAPSEKTSCYLVARHEDHRSSFHYGCSSPAFRSA